MTMKLKTTVTFTFSFTSRDERAAISNLLDWMSEYRDGWQPDVIRDCESGKYTISNKRSISDSFKFDNVAELAQKYGTHFSAYELARAMLEYGSDESVTAKSETIEVGDFE